MRDLLGSPVRVLSDDTLYRCLDKLLAHKRAFFSFLRQRWEVLFQARFDVLLYDLTSTYFESDPPFAGKRQFGYSRDKRSDCVQVVIALVVTPQGFPLAYEVMPGNTSDKTTLKDFLAQIEAQYGRSDRVWIMDRGIPTEETLEQMRKARDEERFDGMWVLRTNTELSAVEIALRYKQLWMVEQIFRTAKSLLDTRPIFHKTDATICGHVFCSFLALVLRDELFRRMDNAGVSAEWDDILRDLNALTETAITYKGKTFVVRSNTVGVAGKIAQCVGVRLPNTVRQIDDEKESADQSL